MSVGSKSETYTFSFSGLPGLTVTPSAASFTAAPGSVTPWNVTFLRTAAAPLNVYSKGMIKWTGNQGHIVTMPVVVQPVRFQAPLEVSGSGATSSVTYSTKAGYTGNLSYSIRGLQAATKFDRTVGPDAACSFNTANPSANVAAGNATVDSFTTPAGASYIRFQLFNADTSPSVHDLDLFVYRAPPAPAPENYVLVLISAGGDSNEVANSTSVGSLAPGARFKMYVHGCGVDAGGGSFTAFAWGLTGSASNPFSTVPANHAVTIGQVDATTFGWSGLPLGNRYLGRVLYSDGTSNMAATQIGVSTR